MKPRAREACHRAIASLVAKAAPAIVCKLICALVLHTGAVLAGFNRTNSTGSSGAALLATATALQNVSLNDNGTRHSGSGPVFNISEQAGHRNTTSGNQSSTKQQIAAQHNSARGENRRRVRSKSGNGTRHTRKDRVTPSAREAAPTSAKQDNTAPSQSDKLPASNQKLPRQQRQQCRMAENSVTLRESNHCKRYHSF